MNTQMQSDTAGPAEDERQPPVPQEVLRTWAGRGTGAQCSLCGRSIQVQEVEYEIELAPSGTGRSLYFHFDCYRTWDAQSQRGI